jgi:hypothetical protein
MALVPRQRSPESDAAVARVMSETSETSETLPRGLRKFDLGIVPASVTPPRSGRKAAWFAVSTSAAVVCGLALAAVRLVGSPTSSDTIDALPEFPTQSLGELPADETATAVSTSTHRPSATSSSSARPDTVSHTHGAPWPGSPADGTGSAGSVPADASTRPPTRPPTQPPTQPPSPQRTTVGPRPVTPTDPQAMGDRTEQYFALVTEDPKAAHDMCTGSMAREGPEGIQSRYAGVDHVEVQDIAIDRNQAMTTSTVKIVHEDGTETVEQRRLTFTWGGDPKISDDTQAG